MKKIQPTLIASAILFAYSPAFAQAQAQETPDGGQVINNGKVQQVVVTANPLRSGEGDQILTPATNCATRSAARSARPCRTNWACPPRPSAPAPRVPSSAAWKARA